MRDPILEYLTIEKGRPKAIATVLKQKVCKYRDIELEFLKWLKERRYDPLTPVIIEGYTAADIYRMAPSMDGIGVFNFMVTLRESPDLAKKIIKENFPIM